MILKRVPAGEVHRDWSQFLGLVASTGAGNHPAKFDFDPNAANCATLGPGDFVVFSSGVSGSPTQADIVAYNTLYSGCTGTVPEVYRAYNLNGGSIPTSPVFSQYGTQLAFTGTNGITAHFVLLTWAASKTGIVSSPTLLLPSGLGFLPRLRRCSTLLRFRSWMERR